MLLKRAVEWQRIALEDSGKELARGMDLLKGPLAVVVVILFAALPFMAPIYAIAFSTILLRMWQLVSGRTIEEHIK